MSTSHLSNQFPKECTSIHTQKRIRNSSTYSKCLKFIKQFILYDVVNLF